MGSSRGGECEFGLPEPDSDDVVGNGDVVPGQSDDVFDVLAEDDDQDAHARRSEPRCGGDGVAAKRDRVALGSFGTYLEQGSRTGMTHAHIVVKDGHRLDFDSLRHRLASAGFGQRFTYSRINNDAGFSAYIGKGFATYATKGYRDDADQALRLNAGRVGHFSRGFFPAGVRRAEVDSLAAAHQTTEPSPWIIRVWS